MEFFRSEKNGYLVATLKGLSSTVGSSKADTGKGGKKAVTENWARKSQRGNGSPPRAEKIPLGIRKIRLTRGNGTPPPGETGDEQDQKRAAGNVSRL